MKPKILMTGAACFVFALAATVAAVQQQQRPNFSGVWMMDRDRSFGLPRDIQQTMTVMHTGERIELETKVVTPGSEQTIKDSYTLDDKEHDFTPQTPNGPAGKGKRTSKWLPAGNGIMVSEQSTQETPQGAVTTQLTRKWIMRDDGKTLTIDMYFDGPNGSFEAKRVFVKK